MGRGILIKQACTEYHGDDQSQLHHAMGHYPDHFFDVVLLQIPQMVPPPLHNSKTRISTHVQKCNSSYAGV